MSPSAAEKVVAALSDRRRWYALTASVLGGSLVGMLLWSNGPHPALARDLVRHLALEPGALYGTETMADPAQVREVLRDSGVRLRDQPGAGAAMPTSVRSVATRCPISSSRRRSGP